MVDIINLNKKYGEKEILRDINYHFSNKGLYLICGSSGVGKTTLLNIISNKDKEYSGEVYVEENFYLTPNDLIGYFTVKENIELFKDIYLKFKDRKVKLGIENLYNKKIDKLSNGEKQRVCVYISLCINCNVTLLDEPTSSLDYKNKELVIKEIEKESKNKLFIVVSHEKNKFNNYIQIEIKNGKIKNNIKSKFKQDKVGGKEINKINNVKYGLKLIHKNCFNFILFILTLFTIMTSFSNLSVELINLKKEFNDSFKSGDVFYKENDDFVLNDKNVYKDILVPLVDETYQYGSSIYSKDMYKDTVYLDKYYYDNGFAFSNIYSSNNINDNEVIVEINFEDFCLKNNILYCLKSEIKNNLIGKNLYYNNFKSHSYKIRDVIEGSNLLYFNDIYDVKNLLKKSYLTYEEKFYVSIKKDKMQSFYNKINKIDSLLKYDFLEYYEDDISKYYLINKSKNKYFSFNELKEENLIGCSQYGIDCGAFYYKTVTTLVRIDNIDVSKKVMFEKTSEYIKENEVNISSSLAKLLNKRSKDNITLKYMIKDNIYQDTLVIKNVVEDESYKIYKNASYSYEHIFMLSGIVSRVELSYGDSNKYERKSILNDEGIIEIKNQMNKYFSIVEFIALFIEYILVFFLILIECRKNKKYTKFYHLLKHNNVYNYLGVFAIFNLVYLIVSIFVLLLNFYVFIFYVLWITIFTILEKIKIQVSLD